ncbi:hypothetical protein V1264_010296 [Littorina saxatilis]|uniref:Uncharacterized protein n=1 Tax=Littorina saxatilis TaxID=31220 RepID=A0AAN9G0B3_9CAEN
MKSQMLPCVLILLPLISPLSASAPNNSSRDDCGTEHAVDCMKFSQLYQSLQEDLRYTECVNATRSVRCLEAMLSRCPSLEEEEKDLYAIINQQVLQFREDECSAATIFASSLTLLLTSLLLLYGFPRLINILC